MRRDIIQSDPHFAKDDSLFWCREYLQQDKRQGDGKHQGSPQMGCEMLALSLMPFNIYQVLNAVL